MTTIKPNEPIVFRRDRSLLLIHLVPTVIFAVVAIVFLVLSFTPLPHTGPYPLGVLVMGGMFALYLHSVMLVLGQRVEVFSDRVVTYAANRQFREHRLGEDIQFYTTVEKDVAPFQYSDNITTWNLRSGATRVKLPPSRETVRHLAELKELFPSAIWPPSTRLTMLGQQFRKNLSSTNNAIQVIGLLCALGIAFHCEKNGVWVRTGPKYARSAPVHKDGTQSALIALGFGVVLCAVPLWKSWRGYIWATPKTLTYCNGFRKVILAWEDVVFAQLERTTGYRSSRTRIHLKLATKDNHYEFRDDYDAFKSLVLMASTSIPGSAITYFPEDNLPRSLW